MLPPQPSTTYILLLLPRAATTYLVVINRARDLFASAWQKPPSNMFRKDPCSDVFSSFQMMFPDELCNRISAGQVSTLPHWNLPWSFVDVPRHWFLTASGSKEHKNNDVDRLGTSVLCTFQSEIERPVAEGSSDPNARPRRCTCCPARGWLVCLPLAQ